MTERIRTKALPLALLKLLLVGVLAAGAGLLLGTGVSALTGDGGPQAAAGGAPTDAQSSPTGGASSAAQSSPAGGGASTAAGAQSTTASQRASSQVHASAVSALLRPAATALGQQRHRARLIVRIRAQNVGKQSVTPARPALLEAGVTVHANRQAVGAATGLGSLRPGQTKVVDLQFEVRGAVTTQLTSRHTARINLAGQSLTVPVAIGPPV